MYDDTEALRQELLDGAYAGAFSGLGPMLLDAEEIGNADTEELEGIARRYGCGSVSRHYFFFGRPFGASCASNWERKRN